MKKAVILGGSGHGREVGSVLRDCITAGSVDVEIAGFLDDDPGLREKAPSDLRFLGNLDRLAEIEGEMEAYLGVGYPETKYRVLGRVDQPGVDWPVLIHPSAALGSDVRLGRGVFLQAGALLSTHIQVCDFVTVNLGATISHDCVLGPFSTVSPGAHLGGCVTLGEGAFIGIGASVVQDVSVGAWSVVGAGALVLEDVAPNTVVAGVPARVVKTRPEGWQNE